MSVADIALSCCRFLSEEASVHDGLGTVLTHIRLLGREPIGVFAECLPVSADPDR